MTDETPEERDMRRGAAIRGFYIAALIAAYGWFMHQPAATYTTSFLVAIGLQVGLVILKRFVPADQLPRALYTYETIADGATVLLFAIGVFGGIARMPQEL
jgi:hypothetical protein